MTFQVNDANMRASSFYAGRNGWKKANPVEAAAYETYANSVIAGAPGSAPALTTLFGKALVGYAQDAAALLPPILGDTLAPFKGLNVYKTSDLATVASLGCQHVRADMWWIPGDSSFMPTCKQLGIDVLAVAAYSLGLSTRGDHYPPDDYQAWSNKIAGWVTQFGYTQVAIWNEPWGSGFWKPQPDPTAYMGLLHAATAAIWAAAPNTKIIVPADTNGDVTTLGDNQWRSHLIALDTAGLLADTRIIPETHNYVQGRTPDTVTSNPCAWDFDRYRCAYKDFQAHGNHNEVWVTEYGWHTDAPATDGVTEQQQADYTVAAIKKMQASGQVERGYCWFLKTGDTDPTNWLRPDGSQKPVCAAVKAL